MDAKSTVAIYAVLPAAGIGARLGAIKPKQYLSLVDKTVIEHSLDCFLRHPQISKVIVALNPRDVIWPTLPISQHEKINTVIGGDCRAASVLNALLHLQGIVQADDWVLVHDAVRPCLQPADLNKLMMALHEHPVGGLLGAPVADTLKKIDFHGNVSATLSRENIWRALTPQMFRYGKLLAAMQVALAAAQSITDEAMAIELTGESSLMIEGRRDNIKITYPDDLSLAEKILTEKITA